VPRRAITRGRSFAARRPSMTNWGRTTFRNVFVAAGTKVLVASFVLSNPGINETIRRTRGRILFNSDQATVFEGSVPVLGMMVVSDLALAAGAASIPGPDTDRQDDGWFVWEPGPMLSGQTDGSSSSAVGVAGAYGFEFDSKAMRKNVEGFGVAVMVEVAGVGIEVSAAISMLASRT